MKPVNKQWFNRVRASVLLVTGLDTGRHLTKMEIILPMSMEKRYALRNTTEIIKKFVNTGPN